MNFLTNFSRIPGEILQRISEEILDEIPGGIPDEISKEVPNGIPRRVSLRELWINSG